MQCQVFALSKEQIGRGLVTSSTGNHALAFLYACKCLKQQQQKLQGAESCDGASDGEEILVPPPSPAIYLPTCASSYKVCASALAWVTPGNSGFGSWGAHMEAA